MSCERQSVIKIGILLYIDTIQYFILVDQTVTSFLVPSWWLFLAVIIKLTCSFFFCLSLLLDTFVKILVTTIWERSKTWRNFFLYVYYNKHTHILTWHQHDHHASSSSFISYTPTEKQAHADTHTHRHSHSKTHAKHFLHHRQINFLITSSSTLLSGLEQLFISDTKVVEIKSWVFKIPESWMESEMEKNIK